MPECETAIDERETLYYKALFNYKILPFLYQLKKYEEQGEYEECAIIARVIECHNAKNKDNLPTRYGKEAVDFFLCRSRENNISEEDIAIHLKNIPKYADEIVRMVGAPM